MVHALYYDTVITGRTLCHRDRQRGDKVVYACPCAFKFYDFFLEINYITKCDIALHAAWDNVLI